MCDSFNDEACDVWNESWRSARKSHDCIGCKESITKGHRYRVTTTIYEGRVDVFKHCCRCAAMCDALRDRSGGDGSFTTDTLNLNCGEVWTDPPPEIAALAFMLPGELTP